MRATLQEKPAPAETVVSAQPAVTPIRWWTVALGLVLIVPNNYWVVYMEKVRTGPYPTTISIFANCVFLLVVLLLVNAPLRWWLPRVALNRAELLTVYSMLCLGSALAGLDMIPVLVQMMGHPFQFGNESNGWLTTFGKYLPRELMVTDVDALRGYYQGNDTLYRWEHLRAWLPPVLRWMMFILALLFVMLCLSNLLRKLWVERERLTFPIVILPLQMTDERVPFWRNGLLWAGILLAGGINVLNGLNYMIPSLPAINVKHQDLLPYITQKPWNAIGWTPYSFYPFVIGLGYLLPLDLVFSCWFFYIFWKAELVVSNAMAWDTIPDFPFIREQAFGGYMAILVFLTWTARGYLKAVWQKAWHGTGEISDREEAMSYRATLIGLAAGLTFLVGFLWYYGMSPVWAVLAVAIYFALTLAVMRMRAELGPPRARPALFRSRPRDYSRLRHGGVRRAQSGGAELFLLVQSRLSQPPCACCDREPAYRRLRKRLSAEDGGCADAGGAGGRAIRLLGVRASGLPAGHREQVLPGHLVRQRGVQPPRHVD